MQDYEKLRELLEEEEYPHLYVHKFIGLNTEAFREAVIELELRFPDAKQISARESAGAAASYLAYTYELEANSADEIIELLQETATLPDVKILL